MTDQNVVLTPEAYKTLKELSDITLKIANDPKTRKKYVPLIKEHFPDKRFPDVETDDIREEMKKEFETRDNERKKEAALKKLEEQRNALKDVYDDAAIAEIEKIMEQEGISNYATAAKLYAADLKPAEPTPDIKSGVFEMPKFDMKNINNLRQESTKRAYEVVAELKKRRGVR